MLNFACSLTLATVVATAAAAQTPVVVEVGAPTARVSYADLNLNSPAGKDALNGRIQAAVDRLCVDHDVRDLARLIAGRACASAAFASAQGQIEQAIAQAGMSKVAARASILIRLGR